MAAARTTTQADISQEELLQRAKALVPVLAERAARAEADRRLPEETVADFVESGLLRAANPRMYGGSNHDYDAILELGMEIARGCGSSGWCFQVYASHNWQIGLAPEQAQEDYFSSGPDVLSSSSFVPTVAKVDPVENGFLVSGRWGFSSGCDYASWALLGVVLPDERGPVLLLVPRDDWRIDDTWNVAGMCATGSKDLVIDEPVFVPDHRYIPLIGAENGPARERHGRPLYGAPTPSIMPHTLAVPALGMAQGAIDLFEERMRTHVSSFSGSRGADSSGARYRLAESAAELSAARALMRANVRELAERAARGEQPTVDERLRYRRDHGWMGKIANGIVTRLYEVSGAASISHSHPMQRIHRDVLAATHSVAIYWDTYAELYGRNRLGLEFEGRFW